MAATVAVVDRCTNCNARCWKGWYLCQRCLIAAGIIRPGYNPYDDTYD